jgi:hypothetical protein
VDGGAYSLDIFSISGKHVGAFSLEKSLRRLKAKEAFEPQQKATEQGTLE